MCLECQGFLNEGAKILDIGCGSGIVAKEFQQFFKTKIFGIDIEDKRVEEIPFQTFDGVKIPFPDDHFDFSLISYVLHHAKEPELLLKEAKRVSKKIIIFEDLPEGVLAKIRCKLHQFTFNLFFQKEKQSFNFKTKKEWEEIFKRNNLKIIGEKRIFTNFFEFFDPVYKILFFLQK